MNATKLTPKQRELFEKLKATPGGVLRKHVKPTNIVCYRLLDKDMRPLSNYTMSLVDKLIDKDILYLNGFDYQLKATS